MKTIIAFNFTLASLFLFFPFYASLLCLFFSCALLVTSCCCLYHLSADDESSIVLKRSVKNVRSRFGSLLYIKTSFHLLKIQTSPKKSINNVKKVWQKNNMRTSKDFLIHYNNLDTKPLLCAIQKSFDFYKPKGIDMFKSAISVPRFTLSYLFSLLHSDIYFKLINQSNHDLHNLMKSNLVGSPSIVFHRFHKVDETYIREGETLHPKLCKSLFEFDANALYLWVISQGMP